MTRNTSFAILTGVAAAFAVVVVVVAEIRHPKVDHSNMYMTLVGMFVTLAGLYAVKSTTDRVEQKTDQAKTAATRVEQKVTQIANGEGVLAEQIRAAERDQVIDDPQTRIRLEAFIEKILDARETREKK